MADYEKERQANIARNKALLAALDLDEPVVVKRVPAPMRNTAPGKRKVVETDEDQGEKPKVSRTMSTRDVTASGTRRSSRNAGKTVDYNSEQIRVRDIPKSVQSGLGTLMGDTDARRETGKRIYDPKKFGAIPGVEIGDWWETREDCSTAAVHAPWVAGISGGPNGAYSVALSGGYDDDVDCGNGFTYTGSGGRDLKGTKTAPKNLRTAPQSSDQTFEHNFNRALKRSCETKKPIRVIRGYKLPSVYAPAQGYRYDGLYTVEKAWLERGNNPKGFKVCKFLFKRIDGQPPLVVSTSDDSEDTASEKSDTDTAAKSERPDESE